MKELTRAEEDVMQVLWKLQQGFLREILAEFPEPKPAPTTVATILRIMETKGFVSHETFNKSNRYFPLVSKEEYSTKFVKNFISKYFENSFFKLVSAFAREEKLSVGEIDELKKIIAENGKDEEKQ